MALWLGMALYAVLGYSVAVSSVCGRILLCAVCSSVGALRAADRRLRGACANSYSLGLLPEFDLHQDVFRSRAGSWRSFPCRPFDAWESLRVLNHWLVAEASAQQAGLFVDREVDVNEITP